MRTGAKLRWLWDIFSIDFALKGRGFQPRRKHLKISGGFSR